MNINTKKILVAVLVITAVALAGVFYNQKKGIVSSVSPNSNSNSQEQAAAVGLGWRPIPGSEEESMFSIKIDSTEEEKAKHYQYAISIAKESEFLDLSTCKPQPLVWKVTNESEVTLKNDSDAQVTMGIDPEHIYVVEANSTETITADFGKGQGLYGYGFSCNGAEPGSSGWVFVVPE